MSSDTLKKVGLEYIEEMATDRKLAQKEAEIYILGAKKSLLTTSNMPSISELEIFVENYRNQVSRIIDSELNRITIKSLSKIREILLSNQLRGLETESILSFSGEEKSKQGILLIKKELENSLRKEIEVQYKSELRVLEEEAVNLQKQISIVIFEKNAELRKSNDENAEKSIKLKQFEDKFNQTLLELKKLNSKSLNLTEKNDLLLKHNERVSNQLAIKEAVIEQLKKEQKIQEKDIEQAILSIENAYQTNEEFYQTSINETVQQTTNALKREFQAKQENLEARLAQEIKINQEKQYQDNQKLKLLNQELKLIHDEKRDLETQSKKLKDKINLYSEENTELKTRIMELSGPTQGSSLVLNYTQRLLSTNPMYAAITILANLGGTLDLLTLAKSVGAHPIKLRQMFEELVERGLLKISDDDPPIIDIVDI